MSWEGRSWTLNFLVGICRAGEGTSRLLKKRELCGFLVAEDLTMSDYDECAMRS
jgi:hypothetical protein